MKPIYFDHAAGTPDRTHSYAKEQPRSVWNPNPHSLHAAGIAGRKHLRRAEEDIMSAINADNGHIIWTGSGSQANNLVIRTACCTGELVGSMLEHKSITQWYRNYAGDGIPEVLPDGTINIQDALNHVMKWTKLFCLQHANNETGAIQPVASVAAALAQTDTHLHVDAVQSFGKIPVDVQVLGCRSLTLSAHKFYGPKGIGCLWVDDIFYQRLLDEGLPYIGTPSTELAQRMAYAALAHKTDEYDEVLLEKEGWFIGVLEDNHTNYQLNVLRGPGKVPGILSIAFPGVDADLLMMELSRKGVYISTGSACNRDPHPSDVLEAMGLSDERISSTVRISLGDAVSHYAVLQGAELVAETVKELSDGSQSGED